MCLVNRAFEALIAQRGLRQHGRAADSSDEHRIRFRGDEFQRLASHRLIGARILFSRDKFNLVLGEHRREDFQKALAERIIEAYVAQALDLVAHHVRDQRLGNQVVVLRGLEDPAFGRVLRLDHRLRTDRAHQRHFSLCDDRENRKRRGRRGWADDGVDFVLLNQLLGVLHGARGIAAVVERDVFNGETADGGRQQRNGVSLWNTDGGGRACGRNHRANFYLRMGSTSCQHGRKRHCKE